MSETIWRKRIVGYEDIAVSELINMLNESNWREHPDAQGAALDGVLTEVGVVQNILINLRLGKEWPEDKRGIRKMVDGHLRVKLGHKRGQATLPTTLVDLNPPEEGLVLATLDPLGALAKTNPEAFDALLRRVSAESPAVQKMLDDMARDAGLNKLREPKGGGEDKGADLDHAQELQKKWATEAGQLWEIPSATMPGQAHRLLCGDSTNADDVRRLMAGRRAALFATDPPYLVDYDGNNHPHKWNEPDGNKDWSDTYHDWDKAEQGEGLYDGFIKCAVEIAIAEDAAWYCWHASRNQAMLEAMWLKYGAFVHQQIIWMKDRPVLTRSWYMWQHEPCFFGWVKGKKPKRTDNTYPSSVWEIPTIAPGTSTDHPTQKPVEVFVTPMRQHTAPGDLCYEPFSGSGTQLVAGEQLGRLVYAIEREAAFVAVALERLAGMGLEPRLAAERETAGHDEGPAAGGAGG